MSSVTPLRCSCRAVAAGNLMPARGPSRVRARPSQIASPRSPPVVTSSAPWLVWAMVQGGADAGRPVGGADLPDDVSAGVGPVERPVGLAHQRAFTAGYAGLTGVHDSRGEGRITDLLDDLERELGSRLGDLAGVQRALA